MWETWLRPRSLACSSFDDVPLGLCLSEGLSSHCCLRVGLSRWIVPYSHCVHAAWVSVNWSFVVGGWFAHHHSLLVLRVATSPWDSAYIHLRARKFVYLSKRLLVRLDWALVVRGVIKNASLALIPFSNLSSRGSWSLALRLDHSIWGIFSLVHWEILGAPCLSVRIGHIRFRLSISFKLVLCSVNLVVLLADEV